MLPPPSWAKQGRLGEQVNIGRTHRKKTMNGPLKWVVVLIAVTVVVSYFLHGFVTENRDDDREGRFFEILVTFPCSEGVYEVNELTEEVGGIVSYGVDIYAYVSESDLWENMGEAFFKYERNRLLVRIVVDATLEVTGLEIAEYTPNSCATVSELTLLYALTLAGPEVSIAYATFEIVMTIAYGEDATGWIIEGLETLYDEAITLLMDIPDVLRDMELNEIFQL